MLRQLQTGIIQSAKDLNVIDDNGKRILNEQLITEEKDYSSKTDDNDSSEDDTSRLVYNDGEQEYYR